MCGNRRTDYELFYECLAGRHIEAREVLSPAEGRGKRRQTVLGL